MEVSSIPLFFDKAKPVTQQSKIAAVGSELVLPPPYQRHENSNQDSLLIAAKMMGVLAMTLIAMIGYLALR